MDMQGEYRIQAPRPVVWSALNDPEILKASIPGCETLEKTSDTEFTAKVRAKVGPVSAAFNGKVTLSDLDPPNGYRISGEGTGGAAGFAKGGASVSLEDDGDATLLKYVVNAQVGGKLAQIGSRLIDGTARKMAEDFFRKFATATEAAAAGNAARAVPAAPAAEPSPAAPAPEPVAAAVPPPAEPPPAEPPRPAVGPGGPATAAPPPRPEAVPPPPGARPSAVPPPREGLSPVVWVVGAVVVVGLILWFALR